MPTGGLRLLWRSLTRHAFGTRSALSICMAMLSADATLAQEIDTARYILPTTRYDHGVLGDAVEWGGLKLTLTDGRTLRMTLPNSLVFEDIQPRVTDLDGDGAPEVIVVESSLTQGARLSVYNASGRVASTPHIGTRNRWLAPVGAADLDGDGHIEIAYIDRPHLAKTLRIWRYRDRSLTEVAAHPGLTNHKIGWNFIAGGIRICGDTPQIITASGDWSRIVATTFDGSKTASQEIGRYHGPQSLSAALTCP